MILLKEVQSIGIVIFKLIKMSSIMSDFFLLSLVMSCNINRSKTIVKIAKIYLIFNKYFMSEIA